LGAAKLSGGGQPGNLVVRYRASQWQHRAILRRAPVGYGAAPTRAAGLNAEATLMQLAHDAGLPSPRVLHVLQPQDELGTGFIMARVEGETIARKFCATISLRRPARNWRANSARFWPGSTDCRWRNCPSFAA